MPTLSKPRAKRTSSADGKHPYLKGPRFWNGNKFWDNDKYSPTARAYYDNWLQEMNANERSLTRLGC